MGRAHGFTLTELIVAVMVLGTMAAFAIPRLTSSNEKVIASEGYNLLTAAMNAQKVYYLNTGGYATSVANLDVQFPNSANFGSPPVTLPSPANAAGGIVAKTTRTGLYTLSIDDSGNITCTDVAAGSCTSIGCTKGGGTQCN